MATNNNNNEEPSNHPACAACKYQRKKCAANCILRRHFPASNTDGFAAVHKIFGVANVTKMMREANSPADQDEIAKSLYWEAAMWVQDPVRGPYGTHLRLQDEIRVLQEHVNRQRLLLLHNNTNTPTINNFHANMNMLVNTNINGNVGPDNYPNVNFRRPLLYAGSTRQLQGMGISINEGHGYVTNSNSCYVPRILGNVIRPDSNTRVARDFGFDEAMNQEELDNVTWQQQNYTSPKHDKMH
ncbi:LOB domain-containing protein 2 [Phtheirospermum japonicum]|uniref:LOB domain-containing protein 2 n=1 Tax=Phtheirospermum japonicum TaxID=374723 RepID=A0A830CT95_9LAMI|nr:LOB domain-containing protein 2 [Phtheirospermum japonicum]